MGKLYFKLLFLVLFCIFIFGIFGPYLISAASTELVLIGAGLIVLIAIPVIYYLSKSVCRDFNTLINKEK